MRPIVIGTGFLGRVVTNYLYQVGLEPIHTFNKRKYFDDSVQLNLFSQDLAQVVSLSEIDTVVITAMIENLADTGNVAGAMANLLENCKGKRVVYLSSDAVFDGKKGSYSEIDESNPVTLYGRHKRMCEDLLQEAVSDHCIVRTSYIYGYSLGQLDVRLHTAQSDLRAGRDVKKYTDMYKSPVEVNQLAEIICRVAYSSFRGVLHACGSRMSVHEFFRQSLAAMGESIDHLAPDNVPMPAPADCLLDTSLDSSLLKNRFGIEALPLHKAFGACIVQSRNERLAN